MHRAIVTPCATSSGGQTMNWIGSGSISGLAIVLATTGFFFDGAGAVAQATEVPSFLTTPDKVDSRIGPLEFKDGAPNAATVDKIFDTLDFTRALDAYLNSYG